MIHDSFALRFAGSCDTAAGDRRGGRLLPGDIGQHYKRQFMEHAAGGDQRRKNLDGQGAA